MKGQSTVEFLGTTLLFLIAIISALTVISGKIPQFTNDLDAAAHNLEMYRVSEDLISKTGRHSFGSGGTNWDKNSSTVSSISEIGLASEYHVLEKSKVENLSTIGVNSFNYSQFRSISDVSHQYFFNFTWIPIVETSRSFTRTFPPSNPPIREPTDDPAYSNAENRINYGNIMIGGKNYHFLVVAFDGVYDTVYFDRNRDWEFYEEDKRKVGDTVIMNGQRFTISRIQNRQRKPGTSVILRRHLNSFGVNPESSTGRTIKLNRYAVLEAPKTDQEPVKMEVLSW